MVTNLQATQKIIWSGPHLGGNLLLLTDSTVPNTVFYDLRIDAEAINFAGISIIQPEMQAKHTPIELVSMIIDQISECYALGELEEKNRRIASGECKLQ